MRTLLLLRRKMSNFKCGHPKINPIVREVKVYRKKLNKYITIITSQCRICWRKVDAKWHKKHIKRNTKLRWTLVNGKREYYYEESERN